MAFPEEPPPPGAPPTPNQPWGPFVPPPGLPPGFDPLEQQAHAPKVAAPAIGMMIVASLSALTSGLTMALALIGSGLRLPGLGGPGAPLGVGLPAVGNLAAAMLGLGLSVFTLAAAVQMHRLRSYGLCMGGAVAMLVPCGSPCCLANVGVGIWALVVLSDPTVKALFR